MIKIAVTGPESSGKSTLCHQLAGYYDTLWVREYAREYLKKKGNKYNERDILKIARGQLENETLATQKANNILICDTEPINFKIWSVHKYKRLSPSLKKIIETVRYDHYLLCYPDLPWESDPLREYPDEKIRIFFFEWFRKELEAANYAYTVIRGNSEKRLNSAIEVIDNLSGLGNGGEI